MSKQALSLKVEQLIQSGMTNKAIAEVAGCDTSTISRIRTGFITDPSYSVGVAIDRLFQKVKVKKQVAA